MEHPPAGWYPNPENPNELRYWDGERWTEHTTPATPAQPPRGPSQGAWTPDGGQGWDASSGSAPGGWGAQGGTYGYAAGSPQWEAARSVDPWLWQSIVALVVGLCCLVPGLVAIPGVVLAAQANAARGRGLAEEARSKAGTARVFTLVSAGLSLLAVVGYVVVAAMGVSQDALLQ